MTYRQKTNKFKENMKDNMNWTSIKYKIINPF